jgi:membrane-associated phospholipid phosphatase
MKVFAHKIQLYSIVNMPNTLSYEDKSSPDHRRSGVLAILNVGTYGPIFLAIIATWKLYYLPKYLLWFFVFLWINEWIIRFAKKVIKQPRPGQPILRDSQDADDRYYGMPSGHMQHALFITVFLWLVNPSWAVLCICVTITGIILLERYSTKRHTLEQLFVGGISGCVVAYISVMIMQKYYEYY